jgi:NADPH:quinone reductase-like Zn-dependent oxidoreductase
MIGRKKELDRVHELEDRWIRVNNMRNARVLLTALGGPEVLKVIEEDIQEPGAHKVLVRILACGVAFADVLMRRGLYPGIPALPYTPGYDIVGVVESCGTGVLQWQAGDFVAALTQTGGYSRYIVLAESALVRARGAECGGGG